MQYDLVTFKICMQRSCEWPQLCMTLAMGGEKLMCITCGDHVYVTCRKMPHSELISEIDSLKNIIDQYKRSLRSLDDEIELHKLNQKEHSRRINAEKSLVALCQ